jgi:cyclophilin family peptidyl-prolyl cis-trans isomerase/HEAT repeat protein
MYSGAVLRSLIFIGTVVLAGCPSKPQEPVRPVVASDAPLRIRIAQAEVKRVNGLAELKELAASKDPHARALALRGLGRSGSAEVIPVLEGALADPDPKVVTAALTAIGVLAAIDETLKFDTAKIVALLTHSDRGVRLAVAEALGRAGGVDTQTQLGCADRIPECALALGRHGRRKLALGPDPRRALVFASSQSDPALRYAATYSLAREHEPPADETVIAALVARIADENPETRAVAIMGLAKRKAVTSGDARTRIEAALRDSDWRVVVEAVRALAAADDAGRTLVATSLAGRDSHAIHEGLRALIGKTLEPAAVAALTPLAKEPGWTGCRAAAALGGPGVVESITSCQLPDHLRLPLLAEIKDAAAQRAAIRVLLAHEDPRVRGAGIGLIASTWEGADARAQQTIVATLTSALTAKNPIVAGNAVEAISNIYEAKPDGAFKPALDAAIVTRADGELDVELATSLFGVIEKQLIAAGLDACRKGLSGHPTRAKAAAKCLRALGEAVPADAGRAPEVPPVDVSTVIGRQVIWHLTTVRGEITIELRPDVAPWAVASIVALTQRKQHDGIELHRVVPNFVAQGGDPTSSGWGGPGYTLPAEPSGAADGAGFVAGGVGIADAGPDSGGSQWFIMHSRAAHLDGRYTWVGSVTSGQDIASSLVIGDKVERATVEIK